MRIFTRTSTAAGFLFFAALAISLPAAGSDFYVSQTGADNNNGLSLQMAWKTLGHAVNNVKAGDRIHLQYSPVPYESSVLKASGLPGSPITIVGEGVKKPVISASSLASKWSPSAAKGVWYFDTTSNVPLVFEDGKAISRATNVKCLDGSWYWEGNRLYYRPTDRGQPNNHIVKIASRGNGLIITDSSWIAIQNLQFELGAGAAIMIRRSSNVKISDVVTSWFEQGIRVEGSKDVMVSKCVAEWNREGIYLLAGSALNTVEGCQLLHNGNTPYWQKGDRGGLLIGDIGVNPENILKNNEVAYNGGKDSDAGLVVFQAPKTVIENNFVHDNYGSGIMVTIWSNGTVVRNNRVERNGALAVKDNATNVAGLTIRRSKDVRVEDNKVIDNYVAANDPWMGDMGPRGGLEVRGQGQDSMPGIVLRRNIVSGTRNGPDLLISKKPRLKNIILE